MDKIVEILNRYGLKFLAISDAPEVEVNDYHNAKIALQKEYTEAILALVNTSEKQLKEALEQIAALPHYHGDIEEDCPTCIATAALDK